MARWPFARRQVHRIDPQAAYALWAATYPPQPHNPLMELEQQTVLSLLPDVSGRMALDCGCGTGRYLDILQRRGARTIGVDLSGAMLLEATRLTTRIARADLCALPIPSQVMDVIVCGLALGDVPDLDAAVAEMARVLGPKGCVVYSVVHPVGAEAGWSRTFTTRGREVEIDGYWHSLDAHRRACARAGLTVTAWQEPILRGAPGHPAVLVVRASRG